MGGPRHAGPHLANALTFPPYDEVMRPKVVVIGAGFGGIGAGTRLAHLPVDATIVDRRNHHVFQPLLYQVATAGLSPADIALPVRGIFQDDDNVDFRWATVEKIDFDGRLVSYDIGELDEVALAYATTVHKSQGSEYPAVVLPLATQHYPMLARNLLYTGVTRGKQLVVVIGQPRAVAIAVRNVRSVQRLTNLAARLRQGESKDERHG